MIGCQPEQNNNTDQLRDRISQFNDAFEKGDVNRLANMITDHYLHTNGANKAINKPTWLNYLKKREAEIKSGQLQVLAYQMPEIHIEPYGQTAIITGKVLVSEKRDTTVTRKSFS